MQTSETELPIEPVEREVRYEHSKDLAQLLRSIDCTLLISTYQAGKLVAVNEHANNLAISFHNFDRPMGVAIDHNANSMAVAARDKVWLLRNARDIASQLTPPASHDNCFLTRTCQVTGEIQAHEMSWIGNELWIVNTLFSCLCTLDEKFNFIPKWRPKFISQLASEDRCHLNGLAVWDGKPKFVTAMAETDTARGWRPNKSKTGCLIDIESNETVARGFAMPHSPRVHGGHVFLLDSGRGSLVCVNPSDGTHQTVARFPGFTRGLTIVDRYAFVGLSKIRETSTFGGVPIAENRERLKCGVGIVNLQTGEFAGQFEFKTGVDEIFDVSLVPSKRMTAFRGPFSLDDGESTIWVVPSPNN